MFVCYKKEKKKKKKSSQTQNSKVFNGNNKTLQPFQYYSISMCDSIQSAQLNTRPVARQQQFFLLVSLSLSLLFFWLSIEQHNIHKF